MLEKATLPEVYLSAYCQAKGLYQEQITASKQAFIASSTAKPIKITKSTPEQKVDKIRIETLERKLPRKKGFSRSLSITHIR